MELWSSEGALQACRRADVEVWRLGALEVCGACRDVEEAQRYQTSGDVLRRVDVETRGMQICSSGGTLQALPQKRYGALELYRIVCCCWYF